VLAAHPAFPPQHLQLHGSHQRHRSPNTGSAFDDAESILYYRDWRMPPLLHGDLTNSIPLYWPNIDWYCVGGSTNFPFDYGTYTNTWFSQIGLANKCSWPGSYSTNLFFDPQDLFNPAKTSPYFINRLLAAGSGPISMTATPSSG